MADGDFAAFHWYSAVLSNRCTLDPHESLVMLALIRYADKHGRAFPGFAALCRVTRVRRTKVIESLAELEGRALFVRTAQTRGKGLGSNSYQLPLEPPTEGLEGERRIVRHAHQSATRTSPSDALGSPPHALVLVRQANGSSAPGAPYLSIDQPNGSTHVAIAIVAAPKKARTRKPPNREPVGWYRFPADFEPDDSHRKLAAEHGLDLAAELDKIRDHEFPTPHTDAAGTLRNWLRRAPDFAPKMPSVRYGGHRPMQGDHGLTGFEGTHLDGTHWSRPK